MKKGAIIIENRPLHNMQEIIDNHMKYLPSDWGLCVYANYDMTTGGEYNRLLTSKEFWENVPFDKVLIFQHDSSLLRKGIEEFLEWDFIGAPLYHFPFPMMNGGLSLRSKQACLDVIENYHYDGSINEDIYFCSCMQKLPTKEIAQKFSVETIFNLGSLGYHAIDKWLDKEQCEAVKAQYKI